MLGTPLVTRSIGEASCRSCKQEQASQHDAQEMCAMLVAKCTRQTGVKAPSACGWLQLPLVVGWWCVLQVSGAPCQQPQLCGRCCDVTSNCSVRGGWQEKQGMVFVVWLWLQETVALPSLSGYGSLCLVRCCPANTTPAIIWQVACDSAAGVEGFAYE
jgi:hypothetical protein